MAKLALPPKFSEIYFSCFLQIDRTVLLVAIVTISNILRGKLKNSN